MYGLHFILREVKSRAKKATQI